MENWIYIEELDIYLSDKGNVKKYCNKSKDYIQKKLSKDTRGYLRLVIKGKTYKIHRLVAYYFISKEIENQTINHKDFNKQNNSIENLEIISVSENVMHYIENTVKKKSSSKYIGVGFHSGIKKWTARKKIGNKRFSIGVFDTEDEAIKAIENFKDSDIKIGKGKSNLGRSKYSEYDLINALILAKKIGVRKAGKQTKMGSTKISALRKQYKFIDGQFVKDK